MEYKELQNKTIAELKKLMSEQRTALTGFRFHVATGQQKNMQVGRRARRIIAQILTIIRSRKEKR